MFFETRHGVLAITIALAACGGPSLPPHTVVDYVTLRPHHDGRRVGIHAHSPVLTKIECQRLIDHYRGDAGKEGQVVVRKPSPLFGGRMTPWCVENFDGKGVQFNDQPFQQG